jgi:hypothetical protein
VRRRNNNQFEKEKEMQTKQKRTTVAVVLGTFAGVLAFSLLATAGSLEPNAPPAPTMRTLDEIYEAVNASASAVLQREGYLKYVSVPPDSNETFFTVPDGKRFVMLKLFMRQNVGTLTVDDQVLIEHWYLADNYGITDADLPDGCVVVNAGETLKAENTGQQGATITIVGYFYDVP